MFVSDLHRVDEDRRRLDTQDILSFQQPQALPRVHLGLVRRQELRQVSPGGLQFGMFWVFRHPFSEQPAGLAWPPHIGLQLLSYQFAGGRLREVKRGDLLRHTVGQLIDAATVEMDAVVVVALACVAPVRDVDSPVWTRNQIHTAEPRILQKTHVRTVLGRVTGSLPSQDITVNSHAVQVQGVNAVAVLLGPVVALIDHQSDMGMSATRGTRFISHPFTHIIPDFACVPVDVVGRLFDQMI